MDAPSSLSVDAHTVVLVEGISDRLAVEALAARRARDLEAEGIAVVAMGGATNIGRFLRRFGPAGVGVRLAGLCDAGEARLVHRSLERAGMEAVGFHVCVEDLEDELIRALGTEEVLQLVDSQGDLRAFRTLQRQPEKRGVAVDRQLRRFMGSGGGRKIRYAPLLVDAAADLGRVPRPLDGVLEFTASRRTA